MKKNPNLSRPLPELSHREIVLVRDAAHLHLWTERDRSFVLPLGWGSLVEVWRPAVRQLHPREIRNAHGHDLH